MRWHSWPSALLALRSPNKLLAASGACFIFGPLVFSGCLYGIVLSHAVSPTGFTWLGRIVPIGGGLMIVGWVLLATAAARSIAPSPPS